MLATARKAPWSRPARARVGAPAVLALVLLAGAGPLPLRLPAAGAQEAPPPDRTLAVLHEAGTVTAVHTLAVGAPPVWGDSRVIQLVPEGELVAPGDTLLVLANERFAARLEEASGQLAVQQKVLTSLATEHRASAVARANAITKARLAREAAELAEHNERFAAPVARERAALSRQQAEIDLVRARQDSAAQARLDSLERARAELQDDRLRARVRRYRSYLDQLVVTAPAAGLVVYHRERTEEGVEVVRIGDTVSWGQHLLDITDVSALQVEMQVHERDRGRVHPGQTVIAVPDAYPDRRVRGEVTRVQSLPLAAEAGRVARRFLVTARLEPPAADLWPGMSVRATIHLEDPHARQ